MSYLNVAVHPIRQVLADKETLCREVLEELPDWFGIHQAVDDYVARIGEMPVFAVGVDGRDTGFVALEFRFDDVCEIVVMGILPAHHRRGLGRALVEAAEDFARTHGCRLLTVKTMGPSRSDPFYDGTRSFYQAMGFIAVDEIHGVWGPDNPCLIMAKVIERVGSTG